MSACAAPQAAPHYDVERWHDLIAEAAQRFAVPEPWVRAVMRAESDGDPRCLSPKGAMGLMQLMPETWAEMRRAHHLGADPWNPRDNVLAGVAYLRAMYDRYGFPDLFAAYNAGPGRVEDWRGGRPLPAETRAYVGRVTRQIDAHAIVPSRPPLRQSSPSAPPPAAPSNPDDRGLFVVLADGTPAPSPRGNELFFPLTTVLSGGQR
ncbi:MAG TPA: lytic transglycosylase domain-containing protein [Azospirillaceae bacterium]|nr:lytic transglycosylase domain-containing protein [Azospirillaceae bacterium]